MADKVNKIEYIEVGGIKCEVKNSRKRSIAEYYQNSLTEEIDNYISSIERWSDSSRNYRDNLRINVIIAPFVLGWLKKPEDNDEYLVIKGYMTIEELDAKRKKETGKGKKVRKPAAKKQTAKPVAKRPTPPKKPVAPKKPAAPKKPSLSSIAKKQDSPGTKKAAPKKTASKTSKK